MSTKKTIMDFSGSAELLADMMLCDDFANRVASEADGRRVRCMITIEQTENDVQFGSVDYGPMTEEESAIPPDAEVTFLGESFASLDGRNEPEGVTCPNCNWEHVRPTQCKNCAGDIP